MLSFAGSITSAIGAFYAADIAKIEAESNALEAKIRAAYARWEELEAKRCVWTITCAAW